MVFCFLINHLNQAIDLKSQGLDISIKTIRRTTTIHSCVQLWAVAHRVNDFPGQGALRYIVCPILVQNQCFFYQPGCESTCTPGPLAQLRRDALCPLKGSTCTCKERLSTHVGREQPANHKWRERSRALYPWCSLSLLVLKTSYPGTKLIFKYTLILFLN